MKTICSSIILFFLCSTASAEVTSSLWTVKKSEHFVVYYKEAPAGYVEDLLNQAEKYYHSIVSDLGFTRFDDFWTWDNRCKIYLFTSTKDYHKTTGQPEWSGGCANILTRTINTFLFERDFNETVLPHEMTHLIFREFIGYRVELPLWLDEGIACFQEKKHLNERLMTAEGLIISGLYMPLERLTEIQPTQIVMPSIFYAQASSIIEFLFKQYGRDKFVDFCRVLRDKKDWKFALRSVYGFKSLSEMNDAWVGFWSQDSDTLRKIRGR